MKAPPISTFLQERIDANDFPSAVYLVAEKGEIAFRDALGYAVVEPERIEAKPDTIYDLASLTKPLVTGLIAAVLMARGEMHLSTVVADILEGFRGSELAKISISDLVTHTSGLKPWLPLYLYSKSLLGVQQTIARQPIDHFGDTAVIYSDLNFILLAWIVEKFFFGRRIDLVAFEELFEPLDSDRSLFNPNIENWEQVSKLGGNRVVAASEKGNRYEKETCIQAGYFDPKNPPAHAAGSDTFRDYQIWGEVHDGNAWFMGGAAGHAGLFSTAEEVFKIALQFLPGHTKLLNPDTCRLFRTNLTKGMNEDRSFAFQLASSEGSTAGGRMPPESFGHNGFTGTSLWIDPINERIFILLTNRTHAHSLPFVNINSVRRRFHDLAIGLLDGKI